MYMQTPRISLVLFALPTPLPSHRLLVMRLAVHRDIVTTKHSATPILPRGSPLFNCGTPLFNCSRQLSMKFGSTLKYHHPRLKVRKRSLLRKAILLCVVSSSDEVQHVDCTQCMYSFPPRTSLGPPPPPAFPLACHLIQNCHLGLRKLLIMTVYCSDDVDDVEASWDQPCEGVEDDNDDLTAIPLTTSDGA